MSREATERRINILSYLTARKEAALICEISSALRLERARVLSDVYRMAIKGWVKKKMHHGSTMAGGRLHTTLYASVEITEMGLHEISKRKKITS